MSTENNLTETPNRSTGPRTPEGKAASARDALRHGLTAKIITGAAAEQLELLETALIDQFDPQTAIEVLLIHELAEAQWRKDRAMYMEYCAIDAYPTDDKSLRLALRYRTSTERAFYKALTELRKMQAERAAKQDIKPAPKPAEPALEPKPKVPVGLSAIPTSSFRNLKNESPSQLDSGRGAQENGPTGSTSRPLSTSEAQDKAA